MSVYLFLRSVLTLLSGIPVIIRKSRGVQWVLVLIVLIVGLYLVYTL